MLLRNVILTRATRRHIPEEYILHIEIVLKFSDEIFVRVEFSTAVTVKSGVF
jgi:hypothetical protein